MSKRNGQTRKGTSRSPDRPRSASSRSAASMGSLARPETPAPRLGGRELAQYFQRLAARNGRMAELNNIGSGRRGALRAEEAGLGKETDDATKSVREQEIETENDRARKPTGTGTVAVGIVVAPDLAGTSR